MKTRHGQHNAAHAELGERSTEQELKNGMEKMV